MRRSFGFFVDGQGLRKRTLLKEVLKRRKALARRLLRAEILEPRQLLASDWQNPLWKYDVDDDGTLSPLDVLVVINKINSADPNLDFNKPVGWNPYFDVDADRSLSPLDVLTLINRINQAPGNVSVYGSLLVDSGLSNTDRISNNPTIVGGFTSQSGLSYTAKARLDRGAIVDVSIGTGQQVTFDPRAFGNVVDGDRVAKVLITASDGTFGYARVAFSLDTIPPVVTDFGLLPVDDTGAKNDDGLTRVPDPRVQAIGALGDKWTIKVDANTLFEGVSTGTFLQSTGLLSEGVHSLSLFATDLAGNTSSDLRALVVDTIAPLPVVLDLASTSDSGSAGDRTTTYSKVVLQGSTEPNSFVTIRSTGVQSRTAGNGTVSIPNVELVSGDNYFVFDFLDIAGNASSSQTMIRRSAESSDVNPVLFWNAEALNAIRLDASVPVYATRNLAMMSLAMLDVVNSIEKTPSYLVSLTPPAVVSSEIAASTAAYEILKYLYPGQSFSLTSSQTAFLAKYADGLSKSNGIVFGTNVARAVIALRVSDGWDRYVEYIPSSELGAWQPTAPMYDVAQTPQWGQLKPFAVADVAALVPNGPPALTSDQYAADFNEVKSLGSDTSTARTEEQKEIARFWADGAGSYTPPGHWNNIAAQVALSQGISFGESARLFAILNTAMADSSIASWQTKYTYEAWRPITAIQNADVDGNASTGKDPNWKPLLLTPPHPEYVSGHSTYSAAAAAVLTDYFGDGISFTTDSLGLPGKTRSFSNFEAAATEAGKSRIYGGIHFDFSNRDGQSLGRSVAEKVLQRFDVSDDTQPPKVVLETMNDGFTSSKNPEISGWVIDNLSGVASASVQIDNNPPVALSLDSNGRFVFQPNFPLDGSADGAHAFKFLATDRAGMKSVDVVLGFVLDTVVPSIGLSSPTEGETVFAGQNLVASLSGTGSKLKSVTYQIDSGREIPISFASGGGVVSQELDLSNLSVGSHTLQVHATDSSGLKSTVTRLFTLGSLVPLTLTRHTPAEGASDIGSTFRPQVFFSRSVSKLTLDAQSLYATDTFGNVLPSTIVPSADGAFAWLFMDQPMPSASTITVHVNGDRIRGLDGALLDADGDGVKGGKYSFQFTTVSLERLSSTSIIGRVVDPGPDLKIMTYDDIKAGPDGILHTPDDIFLNPISNAKVFVLGQESDAVYTDSQGFFRLASIPSGNIKLAIDGRTATNAPTGIFFPEMVMNLDVAVGIQNTVMGAMGTREEQKANAGRTEVYLPRVQANVLKPISDEELTPVNVDAASAPNLSEEQRSQLRLSVLPGSVVGEDGKPLADAKVGISTVPPELVRDMLPPGLLQHTFDITIQSPDAVAFNRPLTMSFPNVFNAEPGTKLNFLSFDHTTGKLVIEGTATVSEDGKSVTTDPGTGITKPGWHGLTPPGSCFEAALSELKQYIDKASAVAVGTFDAIKGINSIMGGLNDLRKVNGLPASLPQLPKSIGTVFKAFGFGINIANAVLAYRNGDTLTAATEAGKALLTVVALIPHPIGYAAKIASVALAFNSGSKGLARAAEGIEREITRYRCNPLVTDEPTEFSLSIAQQILQAGRDAGRDNTQTIALGNKLAELESLLSQAKTDIDNFGFSAEQFDQLDRLAMEYEAILRMLDTAFWNDVRDIHDQVQRIVGNAGNGGGGSNGQSGTIISVDQPRCPIFWSAEYRGETIRGRGTVEFFAPPNVDVTIRAYDPERNSIAVITTFTDPSGTPTLRAIRQRDWNNVSNRTDSDSDRLVDDAEKIIGTSISQRDTDGDGVSDFIEVANCNDPLTGRSAPTGVISSISASTPSRSMEGVATDIVLSENLNGSGGQTAFLSTGPYGLAIVDVTSALKPQLLSQVKLSGYSTDISIDSNLNRAVVAANEGGLHIVNVSDKSSPNLERTIQVVASHVEAYEGVVYSAVGRDIHEYDLLTGQLLETLRLGGSDITGLSRSGAFLYSIDSAGSLQAFEISPVALVSRGTLHTSMAGGKIFVGGGIAYLSHPAGFQGGFATVDVANPGAMTMISGVDANNIAARSFVVNGSGLGIGVGSLVGIGNVVHVVNVSDPSDTSAFITQFDLPSEPMGIAIGAGMAFVAGGPSGLQVVNYRSFDNLGIPPSVDVSLPNIDVDPVKGGIQAVEGLKVRIATNVVDDVQIRGVELLIDGKVVANDIAFPFDLTAQLPKIPAGSQASTASIAVRATDTGGNSTISDAFFIDIVPDTLAPIVTATFPAQGQKVFYAQSLDFQFDESIDMALFSFSAVSLVNLGKDNKIGGGDDTQISIRNVQTRNRDSRIKVFPDEILASGVYQLTIDSTSIHDQVGNQITEPISLNFSIRPASDVVAETGAPKVAVAPSANPGQLVRFSIPGINADTKIDFPVRYPWDGSVSTTAVYPQFIDLATQSGYYRVPDEATTGNISIPGDPDGEFLFQIVPVLSSVDVEYLSGSTASVVLRGRGFSEGDGLYRFGSVEVVDPDTSYQTVDVGYWQNYNDWVRVSLPVSSDVFGAITVTTEGGTSAPFVQSLSNMSGNAVFGAPTDVGQVSANPGQSIKVSGLGLSTSTDFITQYRNSWGDMIWTLVNPSFVQADGSSAEISVPTYFNGSHSWGTLGSSYTPTVQVVPRTLSASIDTTGRVRINGFGYEEGPTSSYGVGSVTLVDPDVGGGTVDVAYYRETDNDTVFAYLPNHGFGPLTIRTSGGSNIVDINWLKPNVEWSLYDVASDGTNVWVLDSGKLKKVSVSDGTTLADYGSVPYLNNGGLQILPTSLGLGGVTLPAGSLLVTRSDGDVFGVSSTTGELLAALNVTPHVWAVGGVYAPSTGRLYLLDNNSNEVVMVNPENGVEIGRWAAPYDIGNGSLCLDPLGSSLWMGTDQSSQIVQVSFSGVELKRFNAGLQNVTGGITGIDFDSSGKLLVSTNWNFVYRVDPSSTPVSHTAELESLESLALDGIPATASLASANASQWIQVTGRYLSRGTQVEFSTIDEYGNRSISHVGIELTTEDGTSGWLRLPGGATTGTVRIPGDPTGKLVPLQIVPQISSQSGLLGDDSVVTISGSGFVEGSMSLTVGGVVLQDQATNDRQSYWWGGDIIDGNVSGSRNDSYQVILREAVEGPITITTSGGSYTYTPPVMTSPNPVVVNALLSQSSTGTPEDVSVASAQPGQKIRISGRALTTSTLVQFPAVDDTGAFGYLTRTGTPRDDGRTLEVVVPGRAISGNVRVVGSSTTFPLQIVPQIDGLGGNLVSGETILLAGIGFSSERTNPLSVTIGGIAATVLGVETVAHEGDGGSPPQQFLRVLVPAGATPGSEVAVTAFGGGHGTLDESSISISSVATSGTPAISTVASAVTGQTITIAVPSGGLQTSSQVVFTVLNDYGRILDSAVTVSSVSGDGKSAQVVVPYDAITGTIRLFGERGGIVLQIVPTISDVDLSAGNPFHSGILSLVGSGFVEGATSIRYAGHEAQDWGIFGDPTEVHWGHDQLNTVVPSWAMSGPISVRTLGGTSDNLKVRLDTIESVAESGTAKDALIASANPGQSIRLTGSEFTMSTEIVFRLRRYDGYVYESIVKPTYVSEDRTKMDVIVPIEATTGVVQVVGDTSSQSIPLQIVPVVHSVDVEYINGSTAVVVLRGQGFSEGDGDYKFGSTEVIDPDTGYQTVDVGYWQYYNDWARLSLPLSLGVFGAITVTTEGGTSAPFVQALSNLESDALVGTPTNASLASANPAQRFTIDGVGLETTTDFITLYRNSWGDMIWTLVNPSVVESDGSGAELLVPSYFNGSNAWGSLGSSYVPTLQIVPRTLSAAIDTTGRVRINGFGYEEGPTSSYSVGDMTFSDPDLSGNTVDVAYYRETDNDTVVAYLPNHGFGPLTIRTSGGSNVVDINWLKPSVEGTLYDVAFDGTNLWVLDSGRLKKVSISDGATLGSYTPISYLYNGGMQILPMSLNLGGVTLPTGSLLVTRADGDVFGVSSSTGELLASLDVSPYVYAVGGVYAPSTGRLYLLDNNSNEVVIINPENGSEVGRWSAPYDISNGSLALDPSGDSLWIATDQSSQIVQVSFTGVEIKRFNAGAQNVTGGITGIDFDASGKLLVTTYWNVVYQVDPTLSPLGISSIGRIGAAKNSIQAISDSDLENARFDAMQYWSAAGLPSELLAKLQSVSIRVTSLHTGYLGLASNSQIILDDDGSEFGWSLSGSVISSDTKFDLVSVLLHEMGHVLGLEDEVNAEGGSLMHDALSLGELRRPTASDVDKVLASYRG